MPKASTPKTAKRSENAVLDQATQQILRAITTEAKRKGQPITRTELRKEGYSERFIDKLENA
jgi:hypothetical protein